MATTIVLSLDKRRKRKDNTFPLVLRLSHKRKTIAIPLHYFLEEKYWDEKNRKIRASYKGTQSVTRLNNFYQKKRADALDTITKLEETNELERLSVAQLKERIVNIYQKVSFYSFTEKLIAHLIETKRLGTARSYRDTLRIIKKYKKEVDFPFEELNYDFLQKFENYFLRSGNSMNGLAVYMRTIRAIYNKAIKEGYIGKEFYPFDTYKIKTTTTKKRTLSVESLTKIKELDLPERHRCFNARNYFLASFYMMGISFIDMAFLKQENIIDGRIYYTRKKTHRPYTIKISDALYELLKYYIKDKQKESFIFPILKPDSLENQYKRIQEARKRYNKNLKYLADIAGVEEQLTSYVSRHTFASLANNKGIPVSAISEMLGHESLKTTQVYLDSLSNATLDAYNDAIIEI